MDTLFDIYETNKEERSERIRTILKHLRDPKNEKLRKQIINGEVTHEYICTAPSIELASNRDSILAEKKRLEEVHLKEVVITNEDQHFYRKTHKGEELVENVDDIPVSFDETVIETELNDSDQEDNNFMNLSSDQIEDYYYNTDLDKQKQKEEEKIKQNIDQLLNKEKKKKQQQEEKEREEKEKLKQQQQQQNEENLKQQEYENENNDIIDDHDEKLLLLSPLSPLDDENSDDENENEMKNEKLNGENEIHSPTHLNNNNNCNNTIVFKKPSVWKGFIDKVPQNSSFKAKAIRVCGKNVGKIFGLKDLTVVGRMDAKVMKEYIDRLDYSTKCKRAVLYLLPDSSEYESDYNAMYQHFFSKSRIAVIDSKFSDIIREIFIVPFPSSAIIPSFIKQKGDDAVKIIDNGLDKLLCFVVYRVESSNDQNHHHHRNHHHHHHSSSSSSKNSKLPTFSPPRDHDMNDSLSLPSLPGDSPLNGIDSTFSPPTTISPSSPPILSSPLDVNINSNPNPNTTTTTNRTLDELATPSLDISVSHSLNANNNSNSNVISSNVNPSSSISSNSSNNRVNSSSSAAEVSTDRNRPSESEGGPNVQELLKHLQNYNNTNNNNNNNNNNSYNHSNPNMWLGRPNSHHSNVPPPMYSSHHPGGSYYPQHNVMHAPYPSSLHYPPSSSHSMYQSSHHPPPHHHMPSNYPPPPHHSQHYGNSPHYGSSNYPSHHSSPSRRNTGRSNYNHGHRGQNRTYGRYQRHNKR